MTLMLYSLRVGPGDGVSVLGDRKGTQVCPSPWGPTQLCCCTLSPPSLRATWLTGSALHPRPTLGLAHLGKRAGSLRGGPGLSLRPAVLGGGRMAPGLCCGPEGWSPGHVHSHADLQSPPGSWVWPAAVAHPSFVFFSKTKVVLIRISVCEDGRCSFCMVICQS